MAKKKQPSALSRLAGKKVVFSGKFRYGVEKSLKSMAEAQQGKVLDDLTEKVDYLVLADLNAGKTIQKKAAGLNSKGATIQIMDARVFGDLVKPTQDELLSLLRDGKRGAEAIAGFWSTPGVLQLELGPLRLVGVQLDGLDLCGFRLGIDFESCSFVGAKLDDTHIHRAVRCDFSKATGYGTRFGKIDCSRFLDARFSKAEITSHLAGADFTGATFDESRFSGSFWASAVTKQPSDKGPRFTQASLRNCVFFDLRVADANFDAANLSGAAFKSCHLNHASFRHADVRDAILVATSLQNADLSECNLTGSNLAECDLSGATLDGADLTNVNLRGAMLETDALNSAKGFDTAATVVVQTGPVITELESIFDKARKTEIAFHVCKPSGNDDAELRISTYSFSGPTFSKSGHNAHLYLPNLADKIQPKPLGSVPFSQQILQIGQVFGNYRVRFETVEVSSTKSPTSGKALRDLVMQGIAEAFAQKVPPDDELAVATKAYRDAKCEKGGATREQRAKAKAEAEKQKEKAKKQIAKKVEKAVGKVTDIATFLKALEVRIERPKIDKATKMLKASGFKLFNDVTEEHVSGVVKSQTDPDLVYACRVDRDGHYACCTQNLNICGGLRGSICKHLLVLIVGLVQAGELDPNTIDGWIAKTHTCKPELDKETMGAIFIKYKGAEAGEVDWRPTETVPEDYYAL